MKKNYGVVINPVKVIPEYTDTRVRLKRYIKCILPHRAELSDTRVFHPRLV